MEYGRYRIVKELGRGNMGVVYQAHDPQIDRMVALKVLRPDRVTSEAFAARFLKEARAVGRLSHPQIVTVFDVGKDHGTIFIAMEYLDGHPLNEVIKQGGLSVAQSVDIVKQLATALYYAHQQGIVHRDIKPSNVILTREMQVKLTDFGIAHIEDAAAGIQTQAGEILGTPMYMSPEQVKGEKADGRSDLYSLGVILYEMVAGCRPFSGNNLAAIFRSITQDLPDPPVAIDPLIGRGPSDLIMKSLDKCPDRRFQTGRQMADALSAVKFGPSADTGARPATQSLFRRPMLTYFLAAAVIVAVAAASYLYWPRHPQPAVESRPDAVAGARSDAATPASPTDVAAPTPPRDTATQPSRTDAAQRTSRTDTGAQTSPTEAVVKMARLKISSEPVGADLYVDSVLAGQTPKLIQLPLGKYELRLSFAGHLAWEAQVELDAAEDIPLHISLQTAP